MTKAVLVLSLFDPWSELHGGAVRTRAIVRASALAGSDVTVVYPVGASPTPAPVLENVRVVPVEDPRARAIESVSRMRSIKRRYLPMPTATGAKSREITAALASIRPDVIVISQLSAAAYIDDVPGARVWMDYSDLWSEFAAREADERRGMSRATSLAQRRIILRREHTMNLKAAIVTAAGWHDTEILTKRGCGDARWLPTPVTPDGSIERRRRSSDTPVAGFLGNFAFRPNVDAFEVLRESWGPRLRNAGWDVVIAGPGSETASAPSWIRALGAVRDIGSFYAQIDLALAPVRLGGGMKVKVVEALMHGVPVVATPFALEGFPIPIRELASVCDLEDPRYEFSSALLSMRVDTPARLRAFGSAAFNGAVAEALHSCF